MSDQHKRRQATPVDMGDRTTMPTIQPANFTATPDTGDLGALRADPKKDVNELRNGTIVHRVTNFDLAICLFSAGVPLRKDPPYTHCRLANGQDKWVFNFEGKTSDGKDETTALIKAFSEDMKFIEANPTHVFTGAMCALKNRDKFLAHMHRSKPWIAFRPPNGSASLLVIEGSKRHENCVRKGMIRCDPFEDQKQG